MDLALTPTTFKIVFTGGPKKVIEEGDWGVPFDSTNPKGDPVVKTFTHSIDPELGLYFLMKLEVERKGAADVSNVTRYLQDGEMVMRMGPKLSAKDGKTMVQAERVFRKVA